MLLACSGAPTPEPKRQANLCYKHINTKCIDSILIINISNISQQQQQQIDRVFVGLSWRRIVVFIVVAATITDVILPYRMK